MMDELRRDIKPIMFDMIVGFIQLESTQHILSTPRFSFLFSNCFRQADST